jgi:hypothetical protein
MSETKNLEMTRANSAGLISSNGAVPCFHFVRCRRHAQLEKQGKSLCRACAWLHRGREYPLRSPAAESIYASGRQLARQLEMIEPGRKGLNSRGTRR